MAENGPTLDPKTGFERYDFEVNAFRMSFQCAAPGSTWDTSGTIVVTNGSTIASTPQAISYFYNETPKYDENRDSGRLIYYIRRHASACREIVSLLRSSAKVTCYHESIGKWQWAGLTAAEGLSSTKYKPTGRPKPTRSNIRILLFSRYRVQKRRSSPSSPAQAPDIILYRDEPGFPKAHIRFHSTYSSDFPDPPGTNDLYLNFHVSLFEPIFFMISTLLPVHPLSVHGYEAKLNRSARSELDTPRIEQIYRGIEMVGVFLR